MGAAAYFVGFPVSLDGLPAAHVRVLLDGLPVFERYGLLLAGGYAFRAHEILHRPSQDLDFATRNDTPLPEIAEHVQLAFQRAGYNVRLVDAARRRYARLGLRLPGSGEELEVDLLKEALEPTWVTVQITAAVSVRAVSLEDTVGLKARAWHDRFVIRDIIDLHAVAGTFSYADLENLARRHDPDLDLEAILDHLAGVSVFADEDFAEYGLMSRGSPTCAAGSRDGMTTSPAVLPRSLPTMSFRTTCDRCVRHEASSSGSEPCEQHVSLSFARWTLPTLAYIAAELDERPCAPSLGRAGSHSEAVPPRRSPARRRRQ